jgi:hypothetical protein
LQKLSNFFFLFVFILIFSHPAFAEIVLEDDFTNLNQVDITKTSAKVDTVNHYVELPEYALANAIDMMENGLGYAVASKDGITLFELNDATGTVQSNPVYSCPWATDATGVSLQQNSLNVWAMNNNSIAYYKFNGSGMSNDPALKVTGLINVMSVAAFKNKDAALILQKVGTQEKITKYDAGATLTPSVVFEPNIDDPVAISMVNDSPDFRLFTDTTAYYFSYDDAANTYVEDPAKKITGLNDVLSASSDYTGNSVLSITDLGYYMNDDSGGGTRLDVFSPGPVNNPLATALKPGSYEQAVLDGNGNVQWWSYDDAANKMVRDTSMETGGLSLNIGFVSQAEYFSIKKTTPLNLQFVRLTVSTDIPENTDITWQVSSDGGVNFSDITPDMWTQITAGRNFLIKGSLTTSDPTLTPKIFNVKLEVDQAPDQPVLPDYGTCFLTATPQLEWTFVDPDAGDTQSAFQVQIVKTSDMSLVLDTGELVDDQENYTVPTSQDPGIAGPLWSSGTYQFKYRVKTWDQAGVESPWSDYGDFCVIAFDRPRIGKIFVPPTDQQAPTPTDPSTYIIIPQGATIDQLPKVKAGAMAQLVVDSIGPINTISAVFPYTSPEGNETATVQMLNTQPDEITPSPINSPGSPTNRWTIGFYTDPSLSICPTGTVVEMQLTGTGSVATAIMNAPPWASGVVQTEGSIYDDWFVVLQGSDNS